MCHSEATFFFFAKSISYDDCMNVQLLWSISTLVGDKLLVNPLQLPFTTHYSLNCPISQSIGSFPDKLPVAILQNARTWCIWVGSNTQAAQGETVCQAVFKKV